MTEKKEVKKIGKPGTKKTNSPTIEDQNLEQTKISTKDSPEQKTKEKTTKKLKNTIQENSQNNENISSVNNSEEKSQTIQTENNEKVKKAPAPRKTTRKPSKTATKPGQVKEEEKPKKAGRPVKTAKNKPVLHLESSNRLSLSTPNYIPLDATNNLELDFNDSLALEHQNPLAIENNNNPALESNNNLAIDFNKSILLDGNHNLAIEHDDKLKLEFNEHILHEDTVKKDNEDNSSESKNDLTTDNQEVLNNSTIPMHEENSIHIDTQSLNTEHFDDFIDFSDKKHEFEIPNNFSNDENTHDKMILGTNFVSIADDEEEFLENIILNSNFITFAKKDENDDSNDIQVADFVSGSFGVSPYGGTSSLGEFGEQGALGVFGALDEAPNLEDILPLVSELITEVTSQPEIIEDNQNIDLETQENEETEKESKTSTKQLKKNKFSRRLKRSKKNKEANQEFLSEDAPIAEGGELSILEAEQNIKKQSKHKNEKTESIHRVLYVSCVPDEQVEVVITENGVVSEYFVEMAHQAKIRGNIYKGIINNVDTNLQAAFVNFGGGKNGFLQIDEVHPEYYLTHHTEESKYPPIQKVLKNGQEVLVQVVKEPAGSKGAFLTTWLSLAGRFIVLTPGQEQIGVSRKVVDINERNRLRELLTNIKPGDNMGVIIRTASEGATKSNIQTDLKVLKRTWKDIQKKVGTEVAPCLIHQEADLASRAVRDYLTEDIDEIWIDSEEVKDALQNLVSIIFPKRKNMLNLHKDTRHTLWERFNILHQLEEVTKREVVLPSGGRLVFDQTEALMAIDINSGKTHGKSNFESMVFRTNMEAVEAIARHLRLRDIGGQIVIDFIEMKDKNHCREVEKAMVNSMKRDKARHDVGRLSSFGLLELVRQRTGTSAISTSSEPCPHCRGIGFRRNLEWQSQSVLRDIKSKLASKSISHNFVHHVEQDIAFYILNKKRDRLQELENQYNIKIEILAK